MKTGVLKYPGGHGDTELIHVLRNFFHGHVTEVWYQDEIPAELDVLFIPGGFPCKESVVGCTCIDDSPAIQSLSHFASNGKYLVGIGNGFQLLCEAGLLPGRLVKNSSKKFICKQVYIKPEDRHSLMTSGLAEEYAFRVPLATYNGRFEAEEEQLMKMRLDGQIIFRFCDFTGRISESVNDSGSIDNIAGICNAEKNVFGLIPQPERAFIEYMGDQDGKKILKGFLEALQKTD